jgi:hypothetical protein
MDSSHVIRRFQLSAVGMGIDGCLVRGTDVLDGKVRGDGAAESESAPFWLRMADVVDR